MSSPTNMDELNLLQLANATQTEVVSRDEAGNQVTVVEISLPCPWCGHPGFMVFDSNEGVSHGYANVTKPRECKGCGRQGCWEIKRTAGKEDECQWKQTGGPPPPEWWTDKE